MTHFSKVKIMVIDFVPSVFSCLFFALFIYLEYFEWNQFFTNWLFRCFPGYDDGAKITFIALMCILLVFAPLHAGCRNIVLHNGKTKEGGYFHFYKGKLYLKVVLVYFLSFLPLMIAASLGIYMKFLLSDSAQYINKTIPLPIVLAFFVISIVVYYIFSFCSEAFLLVRNNSVTKALKTGLVLSTKKLKLYLYTMRKHTIFFVLIIIIYVVTVFVIEPLIFHAFSSNLSFYFVYCLDMILWFLSFRLSFGLGLWFWPKYHRDKLDFVKNNV